MIQIPGYRIVRQLGRGGMATVYLAIQESVDREVALKVMSPALLVDPNFGERFLREARIAAKLHHRHVVGVHDVGRHGDLHYIAMEYLAGGPILAKDGQPKDVPFCLRATREIAAALGYAHSKGFVHRDVKPDNILLRDDGAFALTDFGIARASDSATRMTRTGAVIGTPHYMSPEQARGKPIDGRADLYSLGIVLHELLTGHVPYQADDSLAVGIMHLTEPIPTLPEHLITLQPLLDVMLAKKPEDRYQSGDELAAAIREYEVAIAKGELPSLMLPSDDERNKILNALPAHRAASKPTPEPRSTTPPPSAMKRMRAEPTLGRIEDYVGEGMRPHRAHSDDDAGGGRGWLKWGIAALVLIGIGAGLWFNQEALRKLLPSSQVGSSLARADAAFQAGKLTGSPDSAEVQYRAILSVDPDNSQAMAGLKRVGEKLAFDAREALAKGDVAQARTLAAQAKGLLQGGPEIEELEAALKKSEAKDSQITDVLDQAAVALKDGKLLGEQSASVLYQKALEVEPNNAVARKGKGDVLNALAQQVKQLLGQRKLDEAAQRIADIERLDSSFAGLAEVKALLADARVADSRQVDEVLGRAEALLKKGQIASPPGNNALELYREALKRDPQNAKVKAGLRQIAGSLLVAANAAIEAKDLPAAERAIAQADSAGAPSGELAAARTRLRELREQGAIAAQVTTLTPEKQAQIDKYLADADAALARGDLIDPPGGNAYDMYRGALGLDRNNTRAKAGIAAIPDKAKSMFEAQIASGKLNKAYAYIDAIQAVAPSDGGTGNMRIKLAQAYVKLADQQIGQNQYDAAGRSLAKARELAPDDPSIGALDEKLKSARGG